MYHDEPGMAVNFICFFPFVTELDLPHPFSFYLTWHQYACLHGQGKAEDRNKGMLLLRASNNGLL